MTELIIIGLILLFAVLGYISDKSDGAAGKASIGLIKLITGIGGAVFWIVIICGGIAFIYYYFIK